MLPFAAFVAVAILLSPSGAQAQDGTAVYDYEFKSDAAGWTFGFADLPVAHDQSIFELDHGHRPLPTGWRAVASTSSDTTAATISSCS